MKSILLVLALVASLVSSQTQTLNQFVNDNHVLNYALTLERLEAALYAQAIDEFVSLDFTAQNYPASTFQTIQLISAQETSHVNTIVSTLANRGWPAVAECQYNFTSILTNVTTFLTAVTQIEAAGTSAYTFGAQAITNKNLLEIAAGIATVEARHVAILQQIINAATAGSSFPLNATVPVSPQATLDAVRSLIVSCPINSSFVSYVNRTVNVSSSDATTFPIQTVAALRGDASGAFYYTNVTVRASDALVANYALVLEHLEATFYQQFATNYSVAALTPIYGATEAAIISASIGLIAEHETSHVNFLTNFITNTLQATPLPQCASYDWSPLGPIIGATGFSLSNSTVPTFLRAAYALESTGVSAYVGAISAITNSAVTTVAASIATVEAQHTAYLSFVINGLPNNTLNTAFPNVTDAGSAPASVVSQIANILPATDSCRPTALPVQNVNLYNDAVGDINTPFQSGVVSSSTSTSSSSSSTRSSTGAGVKVSASVASVLIVAVLALLL